MRIQLTLCSLLAAGLLAGCQSESQSQLLAEAKISKADAQATALAKVPNGTVKSSRTGKGKRQPDLVF